MGLLLRKGLKHEKGHLVDALASRGDEGRSTLRKVPGSWEQALIRERPNGETPFCLSEGFRSEFIGSEGKPGELKHLSSRRKGNQRDSVSSGERKRISPVAATEEPERLGKACQRR